MRYEGISESLRGARKYLRLLSFVQGYEAYARMKRGSGAVGGDKGGSHKNAEGGRFFSILSAVLYSAYIIVDNLRVVCKLKFLRGNDMLLQRLSNLCWFFSLIASLIYHSLRLLTLCVKEEKLM